MGPCVRAIRGMAAVRMRAPLASAGIVVMLTAIACADAATAGGAASPAGGGPTAVSAAPTPRPEFDAGIILQEFPPGGPRNEVRLENREDLRFKARASIRLHRIEDNDVNPVNIAFAQGSCTDCQTIAVAVQIAFYKRGATSVRPENVALAANVGCTRCVTAARAIQYVIPVDDPKGDVPPSIEQLVKDMDRELRFLASVRTLDQITTEEALARIQRVLDQYAELQAFLFDTMQIQRADNASPTPSASPTVTASPSPTPSDSPTATASPTPTATPASPTPNPSPSPTATP